MMFSPSEAFMQASNAPLSNSIMKDQVIMPTRVRSSQTKGMQQAINQGKPKLEAAVRLAAQERDACRGSIDQTFCNKIAATRMKRRDVLMYYPIFSQTDAFRSTVFLYIEACPNVPYMGVRNMAIYLLPSSRLVGQASCSSIGSLSPCRVVLTRRPVAQ